MLRYEICPQNSDWTINHGRLTARKKETNPKAHLPGMHPARHSMIAFAEAKSNIAVPARLALAGWEMAGPVNTK